MKTERKTTRSHQSYLRNRDNFLNGYEFHDLRRESISSVRVPSEAIASSGADSDLRAGFYKVKSSTGVYSRRLDEEHQQQDQKMSDVHEDPEIWAESLRKNVRSNYPTDVLRPLPLPSLMLIQ